MKANKQTDGQSYRRTPKHDYVNQSINQSKKNFRWVVPCSGTTARSTKDSQLMSSK